MNGLVRRVVTRTERGLIALTARWPQLGLRACDLAADILRRAGYGCRPETMRALFPSSGTREWKEACRQRIRSRIALAVSMERGLKPYRALQSPLATLRGPAILATFHVGAMEVLGIATHDLSAPMLAIKRGVSTLPAPGVTVSALGQDPLQRVLSVYNGIEALRRQELVMLAIDGGQDGALEIECLGHTLRVGRGAFALARITGAPVIPVVARWRGTDVEVVVGDPLRGVLERDLAVATVRWLERYLNESPGEIGPAIERFVPPSSN